MTKLIITEGLPASGKTTWSTEELARRKDGTIKRINRDDLRKMIDDGKWSKTNENFIVESEESLAELYLCHGYDVIIDNTNLSPKVQLRWKQFAKALNVTLEIKDFTDVSLEECIKRDQKRPNYVGEKVIRKMYNQYLYKNPANPDIALDNLLPECWCFDLDGTLALHRDRSPYDTKRCEDDIVNESVRAILNNVKVPRNIFLVSGRSEVFRPHTERWLKRNEIEYSSLFMRPVDDLRNDSIIKREIYLDNIYGKYKVMGWFDDRLRVCREIHALGLPLFRVGDPESDF